MKRESKILIGIWNKIIPAPMFMLIMETTRMAKTMKVKMAKMTEEKKRIHHFVVRELPNAGQPVSLAFIARELEMPVDRVSALVDEMEKDKTFSKDDLFKLQEDVQKVTDKYIALSESIYAEKEKEILQF